MFGKTEVPQLCKHGFEGVNELQVEQIPLLSKEGWPRINKNVPKAP